MSRVVLGLATAIFATIMMSAGAYAGSSAKTIRVEPRAFYGATVSLEAGVRVFRPLPPTTHMIINPNRTPINLSIKEETTTINRTVNHNVTTHASGGGGAYSIGGYGFGRKMGGRKHVRRGRPRHGL